MINVQKKGEATTQLVVQGNLSMTWRANMWLAGSLAFISFGLAGILAIFGFWMVIPFAGAEVIFVVCCLHWTVWKLGRKEVITISDNDILLEWGYKAPEAVVKLPRHWSKLHYHCPDNVFEVGELSFGVHGKRYAVGRCLGRDEKKALFQALQNAL